MGNEGELQDLEAQDLPSRARDLQSAAQGAAQDLLPSSSSSGSGAAKVLPES